MAKKKKASAKDKAVKAKPTGYRFKTDGIDALTKKDGTLNKKGKKLRFKRPLKSEIEKFKKDSDGNYPDDVKQIYHESRDDKKHSDDNLKKKFEHGGETVVEMSMEDMRIALGREPKYPYDFISGKKYTKCFLKPYYKLEQKGYE
jgi:hypothetical protein